jgi:hypothetical protein
MSSKKSLKVATVQFDPISGNFGYNSKVIAAFLEEAAQERARLVLFPKRYAERDRASLWRQFVGLAEIRSLL